MRKIKLLTLLVALLFSAGMYVQAEVASGTCGTDLAWSLSDDYALTISGTGTSMTDYSPASPAPWDAYKANIVSITLPEGLSSVGAYAFAGCDNVTTLTIPESVFYIRKHALDMASLASLYIPRTRYTFTWGTLPSRGENGGGEIFPHHAANLKIYYLCSAEESYINSWMKYYEYLEPYNFASEDPCPLNKEGEIIASEDLGSNFHWLIVGSTLIISGNGAMPDFANADAQPWKEYRDNIGIVEFEGAITHIGNYAFAGCNKIGDIFLPDALTSIGSYAFYGCSKLWYVRLADVLTTFNADIPEGVTSIGEAAFYGCSFYNNEDPVNPYGFRYISLPSTLTSLGANNFVGCPQLLKVEMNATTPPTLGSYTEKLGNVHIWCPEGSETAYANAENWVDLWDNLYGRNDMPLNLPSGSGTCGTGVTWAFEMEATAAAGAPGRRNTPAKLADYKGTLTISGSGAMDDYSAASAPWHAYKNATSYIELSEGLTKIGNNAFDDFGENVESITCEAETAPTVGTNAFGDIPNNTPVKVPNASAYTSWGDFTDIQNIPVAAAAQPCEDTDAYRGTCGENLNWVLTCDGELVITGSGAMYDYDYPNYGPWNNKCTSITSVSLPNSLTHVGSYAFMNMSKLTTITIPAGVTSLGNSCFANCEKLVTVNLPSTLKTIDYSCFTNCFTLPSLTIPASVTSIGYGITHACKALASIQVEAGNTVYESPNNCNAIITKASPVSLVAGCKNTVIPSNVKTIGREAFSNQTNTAVTIPNGVEQIQMQAFMATAITSLAIPASVTFINYDAFTACESLSTITVDPNNTVYDSRNDCNAIIEKSTNTLVKGSASTVIPDDVTAIGEQAFYFLKSLTSITIPASVKSISYLAFNGCSGLREITCLATVPPTASSTTRFSSIDKTIPVYVPAGSVDAYKAETGWAYFQNIQAIPEAGPTPCEEAAQGTCGENLRWVYTCEEEGKGKLVILGSGAMNDFTSSTIPWKNYRSSIKSIELPDGLTSIGKYAFYMMDEMNTAVVVPEGVTSIGYCAFSGERKLPAITLPNSLTTLAGSVFSAANALTSLHIPANVNSIGTGLTEECNALTSITVDANNQTFDSRDNCNAIIKKSTKTLVAGCKTTVIPNSVEVIGGWAFSTLPLTEIKLPKGVTTLSEYCFQYCSNVKTLNIPSTLVNISGSAFNGCVFKSINVVKGHPKFDSRDNCNAIIETATNTLVKGCENTVIPDGIVAIGEVAFMSCKGLKFINIPASVTRLDRNALIYCNNLEKITCFATVPPTADELAFMYGSGTNIPSTIPVYVPAASVGAYSNAANWNYFTNFVPLSGGATNYYTVKALANHGTVAGTGTYASGTNISLTAVADAGYEFKEWSDGTTTNPKSLTVTEDMTIRALFNKEGESTKECEVAKSAPNELTLSFEAVVEAYFYQVIIYMDGLRVMEIILNPNGTIKSTNTLASSPTRLNARRVMNDAPSMISIALSNLQVGQQYSYTIDTYNEDEYCVSARSGSFEVSSGVIMGDQSSASDITSILSTNNGAEVADLSIVRTVQRNGYFSTLCLPFSMNATQIANSSLANADIKEFTNAEVADGQLNIAFSPVTEIVAGKPYLIRYSSADALNRLDFSNVTINSAAPEEVVYTNVKMKGTYLPLEITVTQSSATSGDCLLFLGANNQLFWPNTTGTIKPFRCYFVVSTGAGSAPIRRGMPVRIVEAENTATNVEAVEGMNTNAESIKVIENGVLYIIRNGEKYNAMGQIVK